MFIEFLILLLIIVFAHCTFAGWFSLAGFISSISNRSRQLSKKPDRESKTKKSNSECASDSSVIMSWTADILMLLMSFQFHTGQNRINQPQICGNSKDGTAKRLTNDARQKKFKSTQST